MNNSLKDLTNEDKKELEQLNRDIISYNKLIKKHPEDDNIYSRKANALLNIFRITHEAHCQEEALVCFNKTIELAPENPYYIIERARYYQNLGNIELARKDLEHVKSLPEAKGIKRLYVKSKIEEVECYLEENKASSIITPIVTERKISTDNLEKEPQKTDQAIELHDKMTNNSPLNQKLFEEILKPLWSWSSTVRVIQEKKSKELSNQEEEILKIITEIKEKSLSSLLSLTSDAISQSNELASISPNISPTIPVQFHQNSLEELQDDIEYVYKKINRQITYQKESTIKHPTIEELQYFDEKEITDWSKKQTQLMQDQEKLIEIREKNISTCLGLLEKIVSTLSYDSQQTSLFSFIEDTRYKINPANLSSVGKNSFGYFSSNNNSIKTIPETLSSTAVQDQSKQSQFGKRG